MEAYKIVYHPAVIKLDIPRLGSNAKKIGSVLYEKLSSSPELYGAYLRFPLKGFRKLRLGDYRVVYQVIKKEVRILVIAHRRDVYEIAMKRSGI